VKPLITMLNGPEKESEIPSNRRQLLKALAVGSGIAASAAVLPDRWSKPVVEAGTLPDHAQSSGPTLTAAATPMSGAVCWITDISVTMSPPTANVTIRATVSGTGATAPPDAVTDASGIASFTDVAAFQPGTFSLIFSFVNPAYGTNTDTLGPYQQGNC
jgi:hypothetical protein